MEPFRVMVFAGIGWRRCDFLANCFCNSFEAEAVIPCPRDDRGRVSDAAAGATRDREQDLFRSRLDRIIDLTHALVKLSRAIEWRFLEAQFGVRIGLFRWPRLRHLSAKVAYHIHVGFAFTEELRPSDWADTPHQ